MYRTKKYIKPESDAFARVGRHLQLLVKASTRSSPGHGDGAELREHLTRASEARDRGADQMQLH